jgi:eukaryotic-like serine/threonine-protein kinase
MVGAAVLMLLISGLLAYTTVYQPYMRNIQATATVSARATDTAQAKANATATVNFQATATRTAFQDIYTEAISSTPSINDPLSGGDNFGWSRFRGATGSCDFVDGAYHARVQVGYFGWCYAQATNFSDLAVQVQVTIITGSSAGLLFRMPSPDATASSYMFLVATDGTYTLTRVSTNSDKTNSFTALTSGSSPAIVQGLNQTNLVAVVARGTELYLYANKQFLNHVSDKAYNAGSVGVTANSSDTSGTEAVFRNLQVWQLS